MVVGEASRSFFSHKKIGYTIRRPYNWGPSPIDTARALLTQPVNARQALGPALAPRAAARDRVFFDPTKDTQCPLGVVRRAVAHWNRAHFDFCNWHVVLVGAAIRTHGFLQRSRRATVADFTQATHGIRAENAPEALFVLPVFNVEGRLLRSHRTNTHGPHTHSLFAHRKLPPRPAVGVAALAIKAPVEAASAVGVGPKARLEAWVERSTVVWRRARAWGLRERWPNECRPTAIPVARGHARRFGHTLPIQRRPSGRR
jgi:hypothetical protein